MDDWRVDPRKILDYLLNQTSPAGLRKIASSAPADSPTWPGRCFATRLLRTLRQPAFRRWTPQVLRRKAHLPMQHHHARWPQSLHSHRLATSGGRLLAGDRLPIRLRTLTRVASATTPDQVRGRLSPAKRERCCLNPPSPSPAWDRSPRSAAPRWKSSRAAPSRGYWARSPPRSRSTQPACRPCPQPSAPAAPCR